jgi:DNA helicase-2/ATP-dependent DNA helicase PcrA
MRRPTHEQQVVLDSSARVRVVRAAPGSGKTWLVAELLRKELESWPRNGGGIVALSFTRVGGEEIRKAVGYDLAHPHFVGTIDAFLFRYVVRPFLQRARPNHAAPRLIPADWSPEHWRKGPGGMPLTHRGSGGAGAQEYRLFEICFVDEDAAGPVLARPRPYHGIEAIASSDRAGLLAAKREAWQRLGWITHADSAFLAAELLADATHRKVIKTVLTRRFRLLIVDELQDTGYFLGTSIRLILSALDVRGVLVGDPDQAIYEFNGARPDLFAGFEAISGAASLPLARSLRCPTSATACASHLKDTPGQLLPVDGPAGRAFLVRYANMVPDTQRLVRAIRQALPDADFKVVARQGKVVEELTSRCANEAKSLHCPTLDHVYRAVRAFRQGRNVKALAAARASLDLAAFGREGLTDEQLAEHAIEPSRWKALAIRCLFRCNALAMTDTLYDWQKAAGKIIDAELGSFALPPSLGFQGGKLKPQRRDGHDRAVGELLPTEDTAARTDVDAPVQTVHGVKGQTHDVTLFVCPDPTQPSRCPSVIWWSSAAKHREERRIAYVALTRTRGDLVMCTSDACYQRLRQDRPSFVASFQCVTVEECIAAFAATRTLPLPARPSG